MLYSFSLNKDFVPLSFPSNIINEATLLIIVSSFYFIGFFVTMSFS